MEFNSNPHNYERRIGGVKPETLLITVLSVLVSAVFYEFFGILGIVPFFAMTALGLISVGDMSLFRFSMIRLLHSLSPGSGFIEINRDVYSRNGVLFVSYGGRCHLPLELSSGNLIGLPGEKRDRIYDTLRELLNSLEVDMEIVVIPVPGTSLNAGNVTAGPGYRKLKDVSYGDSCYYRPVIVLSEISGGNMARTEGHLASELRRISGFLASAGLKFSMPDEDGVLKMLSIGPESSKSNKVQRYSYGNGKHFFMLNGTYFMAIRITDFKSGPYWFFSQGIDSLGFPCYVNVTASMYEDSRARRIVKYMISERSTDLRLQKKNSSARDSRTEKQLRELNSFLVSMDNFGDRLVDSKYTLILNSEHPTELTQRFQRLSSLMDFLGLEYRAVEYYTKRKIRNLLPLVAGGKKYMTNTGNISGFLPLFFTENRTGGIVVGLNSATEKPELFSLFSKNSYNVMILGETGSGKSHFSKLLLRRCADMGEVDRILIIDPLGEYNPDVFGAGGRTLNLSGGDYLELPEDDSFDSLNYASTLLSRLLQIRIDDLVKFRSVITSCLNNRTRSIREIIGKIGNELPVYAEEVKYALQTYFRNAVDLKSDRSLATVIRLSSGEQINREIQLLQMLASAYSWMSADSSRKAVVIDEAHIMLGDEDVTRIMDSMVRNSRHFNTGVINITQNFSDFQRTEFSRNIINNTSEFFVFRSKTDGPEFHELFGSMMPDSNYVMNLKGGKNDTYSECVRILDSRAYPIKIISTDEEMRLLQ